MVKMFLSSSQIVCKWSWFAGCHEIGRMERTNLVSVFENSLGNHKAENYIEVVINSMLDIFRGFNCNMTYEYTGSLFSQAEWNSSQRGHHKFDSLWCRWFSFFRSSATYAPHWQYNRLIHTTTLSFFLWNPLKTSQEALHFQGQCSF